MKTTNINSIAPKIVAPSVRSAFRPASPAINVVSHRPNPLITVRVVNIQSSEIVEANPVEIESQTGTPKNAGANTQHSRNVSAGADRVVTSNTVLAKPASPYKLATVMASLAIASGMMGASGTAMALPENSGFRITIRGANEAETASASTPNILSSLEIEKDDQYQAVEWHSKMMNDLEGLKQLEQDWDSYGASPPNSVAFDISVQILDVLQANGVAPSGLVPSPEGGVGIVFYNGERYADIEIFNDGDVLAAIDNRLEKPIIWELQNNELEINDAIERIRKFLHA